MSGPDSLRAAGEALIYWQQRQQVASNNLANVETAGFRAQRVFSQVLDSGVPHVGTVEDRRAGELRQTGAPLDLALIGEGAFVVRSGAGEELVRSGSFTLDPSGRIVDAQGRALMGDSGELALPPGPVLIDARGRVSVAGETVGRLRVARDSATRDTTDVAGRRTERATGEVPADRATGGSDTPGLGAGPGLETLADEEVLVRQGYLEGSNVSALDQLVELTTIQRSYEAVTNSVQAIDSVMETIANRLGRVE
jgi:flagellar hook-basal body protein